MSTPLTDSINALTTYANEVTGQSDTTLSDAVHTLASGYGQGENWLKNVRSLYHLFDGVDFSEILVLDFEGNTPPRTAEYFMANVTGVKYLTIKNLTLSNVNMQYSFNGGSVEVITFENCIIQPSRANRLFSSSKLKTIMGEIDMSVCTYGGDFLYFSKVLEDVRFKKDTISVDTSLWGTTKLSNDSCISIANALNSSSPHALSMEANGPARGTFNSILGINDDGLFVADSQGTITLADFVTTVKGWTM